MALFLLTNAYLSFAGKSGSLALQFPTDICQINVSSLYRFWSFAIRLSPESPRIVPRTNIQLQNQTMDTGKVDITNMTIRQNMLMSFFC